jgi:hypothetical protein
MTARRDPVEALLAGVADAAAWPATPDVRFRVMARIQRPTAAKRDRRMRPGGAAVRALALALLLLVLAAGAAVALGYRLPGLDIVFGEPTLPAGTGLGLGSPVPLAEARGQDAPRVLLPAILPEPDTAFETGSRAGRIVSLAWRADPGASTLAGSEDLGLVVMAVPGTVEETFLKKVLGPGTTIEPVPVGGDPGWWISGAPHELLFMGPASSAQVLRSVVAGDTLVFARDGTLYRLESALGRDRTLAIAASMR